MKKIIAGIGTLTVGIMFTLVPSAQATVTDVIVCNSAHSDGSRVVLYNTYTGESKKIKRGKCEWVDNAQGRARVSVTENYKWKPFGYGDQTYGDCHHGPNSTANPPNQGAFIKVGNVSGC